MEYFEFLGSAGVNRSTSLTILTNESKNIQSMTPRAEACHCEATISTMTSTHFPDKLAVWKREAAVDVATKLAASDAFRHRRDHRSTTTPSFY